MGLFAFICSHFGLELGLKADLDLFHAGRQLFFVKTSLSSLSDTFSGGWVVVGLEEVKIEQSLA